MVLSEEQLNNLNKEALVIIVASLQNQLSSMQSQLDTASELEISEVTIASYRRRKTVGKRDADLNGLPARVIDHRLPDKELARLFPHGYKELPDEIYRRLHIIPETFIVDEHHVHVYASKDNDGTIVKAPRGTDLFRNSIATPSLVASIINGKYNNALPLEQQADRSL